MSTILESEIDVSYGFNLDWTHKLNVAIGHENWTEDLGFIPTLCVHTSCETSRPLSYTLSDVGHVFNSYDWAYSFHKLSELSLLL